LFNEIEDFESIDEKIKRLSTNFKSRLILTDDFVIDQTKEKISTILKNKEHYIISNSTHSTFQVDPTPLGLSDYNLGNYINQGHFRGIKAYLNLTTSEKQTKIEMYTKFRYEFLLYLIIIISVWIFDVHHMIKSVVTITAIFFIWLHRSNEKELFTFIKIDIESSSKNDNIES